MIKNSVNIFKTTRTTNSPKKYSKNPNTNQNEQKLNSMFNIKIKENDSITTNETIEDAGDYICIFLECEKRFKNFCRWRLHYFSHVNKINFFYCL